MERSRARPSFEAVVLAGAIPLLCLHERYNPDVALGLGSTDVSLALSDAAMLIVLVLSLRVALREGLGRLRDGRVVLVAAAALLACVVLWTILGPALSEGYPLAAKAVSAAKFVEYGLLALVVPLLVRSGTDARALAWGIVGTATAAAAVGVLQIIGLLGNLDNVPAGRRMPSFLGYHDFAALAGITVGIAVAMVATGRRRDARLLFWTAAAAGCVGVVIAGAIATVGALALGAGLALAAMLASRTISARRVLAVAALAGTVIVGTLALRSGDIADFVGFLGSRREKAGQIETYSQRTVLSYIGLRIFAAHPLGGVGWQGSELPSAFEPYLADARARFADVSPEALPSREHPWGVQNAYVQAAADMGLVGLAALLALIASALLRSARRALAHVPLPRPQPLAVCIGLLVCAAEWAALGLVPGVPATALLWLMVGCSVALPRA